MTTLTLGKALNEGLRKALEDDPKVLIMGEDVGKLGGVFRITDGLQKDFGEQRVIDTPLAESGHHRHRGRAWPSVATGPVCEIQFDGFVYPAYDQIVSQVAKMHYRSKGKLRLPIVIRIPFGGGIGAVEHHSESPEAYFAHTAGLKVVACSNPADAYWMIQQAIATDDPVVFFEPKRRYWEKAEVDTSGVARPTRTRCSRRGSSGPAPTPPSSRTARWCGPRSTRRRPPRPRAASSRSSTCARSRRWTSAPVFDSVRRTGRLVVVHEAARSGGLGAEIAARVTEECFYSLEAPVQRVTGFDIPYPAARVEEEYLPDLDRVLDAVDRSFGW